jgi:signal transduction histidine kinase
MPWVDKSKVEPIRLLLVDDDEEEFFLTKKKIANMHGNYRLQWTGFYEEALDILGNDTPDVCLVDYHLDARTGLDLIGEVKKKGIHIPFILLTGHGTPELDRRAIRSGADDFLPKNELTPSSLNRAIAHSLERKKTTRELIESEANFRELAQQSSAILHNVGNILNSMLVTANRMKETVQSSKSDSLGKVAQFAHENKDNFIEFIRDDPRGKLLPSYLVELHRVIQEEQTFLHKEIDCNLANIRLMEEVISNQQLSAKERFSAGVHDLAKIIEDAVLVNLDGITNRQINVLRYFNAYPSVLGSRSRLTHVFINLFKNSLEAMTGCPRRELLISIEIEELKIFVRVQDTGKGIPSRHQEHLFQHGMTTKDGGHGFGLHSCMETITELGGSLELEHTEEGKGTTFLITLPLAGQDADDPI